MSDRAVDVLLADLDHALQDVRTVTVTGELSDWRVHRSGMATAQLSSVEPAVARIRVVASRHAAAAAAGELADAGRNTTTPGTVTIHGQVSINPRWGLQLTLLRLHPIGPPVQPSVDPNRSNGDTEWPARIATIGLVAPSGGDDAYADVAAHCADSGVTVIEHRVPVTGSIAAVAIGHALDRLALDPRPDVTLLVRGGGPSSDFAPFNSSIVIAAIGRHPRPVITGLGHASNITAADHAAHTHCITPTAAAQLIVPTQPATAAATTLDDHQTRHIEPSFDVASCRRRSSTTT